MVHPQPTGYGWLVKLPNGRMVEVSTDTDAYELADEDEDTVEE